MIYCGGARIVFSFDADGVYQLGKEDVTVSVSIQRKQRNVGDFSGVFTITRTSGTAQESN